MRRSIQGYLDDLPGVQIRQFPDPRPSERDCSPGGFCSIALPAKISSAYELEPISKLWPCFFIQGGFPPCIPSRAVANEF